MTYTLQTGTGYREMILVEMGEPEDHWHRKAIIDNVDREGQWLDREQWPNDKHITRINRIFGVAAELAFARVFDQWGAKFRMPDGPDRGNDGIVYCKNADAWLTYDVKWRRNPGGGLFLNTKTSLRADLGIVATWSAGQIGRYKHLEETGRVGTVVDEVFFWRFYIKRWCTRAQFRDDGSLVTVRKGKPDERDRWILEQRDMNRIGDLSVMLDTISVSDCACVQGGGRVKITDMRLRCAHCTHEWSERINLPCHTEYFIARFKGTVCPKCASKKVFLLTGTA